MSGLKKLLISALVCAAIGLGATVVFVQGRGFSARDQPTWLETVVARAMRSLAVPSDARALKNPTVADAEVLAEAREHFADHCAICHANDGSGNTTIGRNLYPKAPDMRGSATQSLSDGELFYIINNGIRLTGMPAWGSGRPADDLASWQLVHFIRRLDELTEADLTAMKRMNPLSKAELEQQELERSFLEGEPSPNLHHGHSH